MRRKFRRVRRPLDQGKAAEGMSRPGIDPRQWVSIGVVDSDDDEVVFFDEDEGQPLVKVTLQPTKVPVYARVASMSAGNGEGEYHPFVKGDEVVVLIPRGREDSGCIIIGKLNNAIDKFPMESVAGQDPTTNTFAFRRRRTPFVEEFAGPVTFRSALNESIISIDTAGIITIKDSENSVLQMSPDVIGFQGPSDDATGAPPEFLMQLDLTGEHFLLQVKDAIVSLSSSTANPEQNIISVPGPLSIGTSANPPIEHAISTEAVASILEKLLLAIGGSLTPPILPPAVPALVAGIFSTAATTPLSPAIGAAIQTAFAAVVQKPNAPTGQLAPGIGCPGLLVG